MNLCLIITLLFSQAIPALPPEASNETDAPPVDPFIQRLGAIAEQEEHSAESFREMAELTLSKGQSMQEEGVDIPESMVYDALDAVAEGKRIQKNLTQWTKLERELFNLLDKPEQQEQQEQDQSQQDDKQKSEDEQQNSGNSEQQQNDSEQQQDSSEEQQSSDQENSEQNQDSEEQQDPNSQESEGQQSGNESSEELSPSQNQSSENGPEEEAPQNPQQGGEMGDLDQQDQPESPELDQESEPQSEPKKTGPMQSIGGQGEAPEKRDAESAAIMQKLEQLKQQDDPAKLFQILQQAQDGDQRQQQQPNQKDW